MEILIALTLFVIAVFLGVELITKVPPTLHTPLMSGSNAISGITIVGALVAAGADHSIFATVLGFLAVVLAMINVVGGFLVTHRMLHMFGPKRHKPPRSQTPPNSPPQPSAKSSAPQPSSHSSPQSSPQPSSPQPSTNPASQPSPPSPPPTTSSEPNGKHPK